MTKISPRTSPSLLRQISYALPVLLALLTITAGASPAEDRSTPADPSKPGFLVNSKFGGQILGYDIDQSGTEGLLSEFVAQSSGGSSVVATETFDQATGKILKVVAKKTNTQDDYVTEGILGNHLALVMFEHELSLFHVQRHFHTMLPFTANKFTGVWAPPLTKGNLLGAIGRTQSSDNIAVLELPPSAAVPLVYSSNVADNTFGPKISLQPIFNNGEFSFPLIVMDSKTNQAVLSASFGCRTCAPKIATVNLTSGKIDEFTGLGFGLTNGLAVDPASGMACTTTEIDFSVEFYNLKKHSGIIVTLPGAGGQLQSGEDVEFDPIHHLFLVGQYTSTGNINDPQPRIYVYDEHGNLKNTVTGLQRIPIGGAIMIINPAKRTGFIPLVGTDFTVTQLQSFTY